MKSMVGGLLIVFLVGNSIAQLWSGVRLNDSAVTNELGEMVVLGTEGAYAPGYEKEAAYDGNAATFFDPPGSSDPGAWAGFELQQTQLVTRIRYLGRSGAPERMRGVLFQGANTSNFTDAVTLHVANPPSGWTGTTWVDVALNDPGMLNQFKYVRFIGVLPNSYAGNAAEVEFYGRDPLTVAPTAPTITFSEAINWTPNFRWTTGDNTMMVEVQRKLVDEDDFSPVYTISLRESGDVVYWHDSAINVGNPSYRIRARNNVGDTSWQTFNVDIFPAAVGTWIGTEGSYAGGREGDKVYDGDINTFFDGPSSSGGNGLWSGLALASAEMIGKIRYVPRSNIAARMDGGQFHGSNDPDFSTYDTLHTVSGTPPVNSVSEVTLASAQGPYRYVRYLSPDGGWGNIAEAEFVLAEPAPKAPIGLAVESSDLTNDYAVLSWDYDAPNLVSSSVVYRATAPGGPYQLITSNGLAGISWTDTNMVVGALYYYKVALQYAEDGSVYEGPACDYVTFRRAERIDRDWSDLSQVKSSVSILGLGNTYMGNTSVDVDKLFDNSFATFYDSAVINPKPGLDFGSPHGVKLFRYSPRSGWTSRVNGCYLWSDADSGLNTSVMHDMLSDTVYGVINDMPVSDATEYQYWYVHRNDANQFYGNLSEMEFYGWAESNLVDILIAPLQIELTLGDPLSVTLDWESCNNAVSYQVERSLHGSNSWSVLDTVSVTDYTDSSVIAGVGYDYRIASVNGAELAYSDTVFVIPYVPGGGQGLKGYYSVNYSKNYYNTESQVLVRVDSEIDFSWADADEMISGNADSVNYVGIKWYGQLIVPFDGDYNFYAKSDDGFVLRIDGEYLINQWAFSTNEYTAAVNLTAGNHTIQIDYYNHTGGKNVHLEWGGAVKRGVLPQSQLIPLDLPSDDIGEWKGRTFNCPRLGKHELDSGTYKVYGYGLDFTGTAEGSHYLYKKVSGSFLYEADVYGVLDPLCPSAKAMLVVRSDLSVGSALLAPAYMFNGTIGCKARLTDGAGIFDAAIGGPWIAGATNPTRLRIRRVGSTFEALYKVIGGEWTELYSFEDTSGAFGDEVYVGMAVCSPGEATDKMLQEGQFSNVDIRAASGLLILIQ